MIRTAVGAAEGVDEYPDRNPFEDVGPATADEVWFPLDPRALLVLSPHPSGGAWLQTVSPQIAAAMVNEAIAAGAYADIYVTPGRNLLDAFDLPAAAPVIGVAAPHDYDIDGMHSHPTRVSPRRR